MNAECCICGAMTEPVRYELFRYVEPLPPAAEGQPPVLFDAGYRCVDRERCQADFEALARATDPKDGPAPRWNIADGPAAVRKPHTSWHARAGSTAPPDRPAIAPPAFGLGDAHPAAPAGSPAELVQEPSAGDLVMALNEKQFTEQLIGEDGLATFLGWQVAHFRPAQNRRGVWQTPVSGELGKGWPDWFLANPQQGRSMLRELKIDGNPLDPDQERVIGILRAAGVDADVWRPADLDSGRILAELRP